MENTTVENTVEEVVETVAPVSALVGKIGDAIAALESAKDAAIEMAARDFTSRIAVVKTSTAGRADVLTARDLCKELRADFLDEKTEILDDIEGILATKKKEALLAKQAKIAEELAAME